MLLSTTIKLNCGVLEYGFNPAHNYHLVTVSKGCTRGFRRDLYKSPGEAINGLAPYREESLEVADLIRWLSHFPHDA
ncbi:hypothetical protein CROSSROADS_83 [Mycobacterium phage Crossroads]|uniref:Uncharacterized protein n=2 Tax=Faithunavirus TaxID=2948705 RepID=F6M878_9CAUD|nr:hypothetical protein SEA_FAITH1_83 [Mycobacterium phage Faith1]YP_008410958.1 hypothetical protein N848_gp083 [Mycobacterium phage Crossroads]YP_009017305.1 hypothetical protein CL57_gp080 [Mycobacterium phage Rumpelstiltskin]YP_009292596.1 hypothetical protein BI025_gp100 [Mycobacterium phage Gardann]AGK87646.1 hypothetical protein PBI_WINKY_83 [Mycobacterium phage Winky]AGM12692.1 hypothetical protein PBI_BREEZONA_83 [Mycobacterium phage Breezona]ASM62689.1 hypothetical protein SEA_MILEY